MRKWILKIYDTGFVKLRPLDPIVSIGHTTHLSALCSGWFLLPGVSHIFGTDALDRLLVILRFRTRYHNPPYHKESKLFRTVIFSRTYTTVEQIPVSSVDCFAAPPCPVNCTASHVDKWNIRIDLVQSTFVSFLSSRVPPDSCCDTNAA